MTPFKDAGERTWTLAITVATVKKCRALAGVDIPGLFDDECKGLQSLTSDPCAFCDVLLILVADQMETRQIDEDDFLGAMYGDALEDAMDAFLGELCDFFPDLRKRQALRNVLQKSRVLRETLMDQMELRMDEVDIAETARSLMTSYGGLRESSDATRGNGPPANS